MNEYTIKVISERVRIYKITAKSEEDAISEAVENKWHPHVVEEREIARIEVLGVRGETS